MCQLINQYHNSTGLITLTLLHDLLSKYLGDLFERGCETLDSTMKIRHAILTHFMIFPQSERDSLIEAGNQENGKKFQQMVKHGGSDVGCAV